jgi:hypothetical protein
VTAAPTPLPPNRTWTITGITPHALNVCYLTFYAFAMATGLFWLACGYRYFRPVLYTAGFFYGLYCTMCIFASRITLGTLFYSICNSIIFVCCLFVCF